MTDAEFLDYCETHSETPRCGFTPASIARLLRLAGDEKRADVWILIWGPNDVVNCDRGSVKEAVAVARNIAAAFERGRIAGREEMREEAATRNTSQEDIDHARRRAQWFSDALKWETPAPVEEPFAQIEVNIEPHLSVTTMSDTDLRKQMDDYVKVCEMTGNGKCLAANLLREAAARLSPTTKGV